MPKQVAVTVKCLIPVERIERRIYMLRGHKVMLSADLAELYGVPAMRLNQAVRRNGERFPDDFMFQLTWEEAESLRSQIVILKAKRGGHAKYRPYAFTEEGIAMLSAVLRSPTAIAVSIQIMRAFVRLREILASHADLRKRLDDLERKMSEHDERLTAVFDAIRELMAEPAEQQKTRIGYATEASGR